MRWPNTAPNAVIFAVDSIKPLEFYYDTSAGAFVFILSVSALVALRLINLLILMLRECGVRPLQNSPSTPFGARKLTDQRNQPMIVRIKIHIICYLRARVCAFGNRFG